MEINEINNEIHRRYSLMYVPHPGESFTYTYEDKARVPLTCIEQTNGIDEDNRCAGCFFNSIGINDCHHTMCCQGENRPDKKDVIFIERNEE